MIGGEILKQFSILIIGAVKFIAAAPTSYLLGYSYLHTILNLMVGGLIGVTFFYFLGKFITARFLVYRRITRHYFSRLIGISAHGQILHDSKKQPSKTFTRTNRVLVKVRGKFGFAGLIILTPVLLSIPIGTFLVVKYYSTRPGLLVWLSLSVIVWSVVLSTFIEIL